MTGPRGVEGAAAELILRALFLDPRPERLEALSAASASPDLRWEGVVPALELHGVLPLVWRNLRLAGVSLPPEAASEMERRDAALREDARRGQLTLERFVERASERGVRVILLKGASIARDLYPDGVTRPQGDVDVLVDSRQVASALSAARAAGFTLSEDQLPVWWYRLTHFHVKLHPTVALLQELEIHWRLASPARLHTVDLAAVRRRLVEVLVGAATAWTLDPLDRFLHLATHLVSHWQGMPAGEAHEVLKGVLAEPLPPVRLKWVVDLAGAAERLAASAAPRELARRSREWSTEAEVRFALWVIEGTSLSEGGRAWSRKVAEELRPDPAIARRAAPRRSRSKGPHPALDFRPEALARLPRWIFPPRGFPREALPAPGPRPGGGGGASGREADARRARARARGSGRARAAARPSRSRAVAPFAPASAVGGDGAGEGL